MKKTYKATPNSKRINITLDPKHYEKWLLIPPMRRSKWVQRKLDEDS